MEKHLQNQQKIMSASQQDRSILSSQIKWGVLILVTAICLSYLTALVNKVSPLSTIMMGEHPENLGLAVMIIYLVSYFSHYVILLGIVSALVYFITRRLRTMLTFGLLVIVSSLAITTVTSFIYELRTENDYYAYKNETQKLDNIELKVTEGLVNIIPSPNQDRPNPSVELSFRVDVSGISTPLQIINPFKSPKLVATHKTLHIPFCFDISMPVIGQEKAHYLDLPEDTQEYLLKAGTNYFSYTIDLNNEENESLFSDYVSGPITRVGFLPSFASYLPNNRLSSNIPLNNVAYKGDLLEDSVCNSITTWKDGAYWSAVQPAMIEEDLFDVGSGAPSITAPAPENIVSDQVQAQPETIGGTRFQDLGFTVNVPANMVTKKINSNQGIIGGTSIYYDYNDDVVRPQQSEVYVYLYNDDTIDNWLRKYTTTEEIDIARNPQYFFHAVKKLDSVIIDQVNATTFSALDYGAPSQNAVFRANGYIYVIGWVLFDNDLSQEYQEIINTFRLD